ncbi:hypothetical protein [Sphingosinicella sp. CPCC 101087]|uniref:hypothetical protein n=1 Tax=Sphingosinicella sp. CPCC 101087 TaxID=2497754 RepID=UPI00101C0F05|nr:hypothetical protein [Sphingosinicella sp. CPCC 101087]
MSDTELLGPRHHAGPGRVGATTVNMLLEDAAQSIVERPTMRRNAGVLVATASVLMTLGASVDTAPPGARRGDLITDGAAA